MADCPSPDIWFNCAGFVAGGTALECDEDRRAFRPEGMARLAALPHVMVKLSGITAYAAPGLATAGRLQPWVDLVIDRFGPDRVVRGDDWPVVNLGTRLLGWIDLTRAVPADLSADERAAIGHKNARLIYGL